MKASSTLMRLLLLFTAITIFSSCRKDEDPSPTPATADSTREPTEEAPTPIPEPPDKPEAVPTPDEDDPPAVEIDWSPQIIYSSPAPGEEVLLSGAITLRFDQPMDESSVEEALRVSTSDERDFVGGDISWPRADTLVFTPEQNLERMQEYQVELSEKARGRNGKPLLEPVAIRLQTVGFLDVSQVIPSQGTSEVQSDAAVTVVFNRPVVPLVSTSQQEELIHPLAFEPDAPGEGEWVSTSIYRFTPDGALAGGTRYQVTVGKGLEDLTGGILESDFIWDFTTEGPDVVSTDPSDLEEDIDPSRPITITFNMPMERSSTEAAISLSPASSVTYHWSNEDRVISLVPDPLLDLETHYRLSVANSARSANGQAALSRDRSIHFNTIAFPAVLNTRPANGGLAAQHQRGLQIIFASPMDMDTLQDQLIITPEPENPVYYFNDYDFSLSVNFDLERNADYMVTVPGSAADFYENSLGQDYTWHFQTPGYSPMVSMNLPMGRSQLSTSYPSNVDIIHRNVSGFSAELRPALLPENIIHLYREADPVLNTPPIRTWSESLEVDNDVIDLHTLELADGGVLPTGAYVLTLNSSDIVSENTWWQNHSNVIIVGDTNITVKEMFGRVYVWATELATGLPASGRNLTFYNRGGLLLGSAITDDQGLADIEYWPVERYLSGVYILSNNPGEEGFGIGSSSWSQGIDPWTFGVEATNSAQTDRYAYLYTDRPIYRPGDTVYYKGIVRNNDFGRFPLPMNQDVTMGMVYLSDYEPLEFEYAISVDENGEFDGEYVIPEDASLGTYALNFDADDIHGSRQFTVAEYRKPEFQVTVTPEQDEVVRGYQVDVLVEASYFFGGAAADLPVSWVVYETDYRFDWDRLNYRFGDFAGFNFFWPAYGYSDESYVGDYVTDGTGRTDGDGRFVVQLPAELLEDVAPGSRRVTVEATVQDVSDFPVTGQSEIVYHAADTYVGVATDRWFATAGTGAGVEVITVDWDGDPVGQQEVVLTLYRREWLPVRETEIGRYTTRWEVSDTEEDSARVTTDSQGKASTELVPNDGGSYLIVAETYDDSDRIHTSSTFLWVSSPNYVGWRVDPKDRRMDLTLDQDEYKPGDTARLLIQSPFAGPVQAWLTIERGDLIEQRVVILETNSDVVDIPIIEEYAPNVFVTVHSVKGIDDSNEFADMRIGMAEVIVSPEHLGLKVTLTPQSDWFRPGDTVDYDITVTDLDGIPVQANISLALVDLAVLSLMEDNAPQILEAFYTRQPLRSNTGAGLIYSGEGLEIEIPLEIGGMGGGGGGFDESALRSIALDDGDNIRKDFPDTAFWRAKVSTDADGQAEVSIPLPDSLTTWRLSSKAVSEYAARVDTMVGQDHDEIIATLPLLIRPITPRFFTVGDKLQLGAVVHNNTEEPVNSAVSLTALGLILEGETEQIFTIPAGGREVVRWPVTVDDVRFADLTFRVEGGGFSDASKPTFGLAPDQLLPVVRYAGEDVVGTSGVLDEAGRRVEAILLPQKVDLNQGSVEINLNPSLAAAMLETLDYIKSLDDRPACAHAVTDQLLPNVAAYHALELTGYEDQDLAQELQGQIEEDIVELEELQQTLGGWSWCYSEQVDPILSAYSLLSLAKAQQAGFTVSNDAIDKGGRYLERELGDAADLAEPTEANRQAFFLYVLSEINQADADLLNELFDERRALLDPYARGLLLMAFDNTGSSNSQESTLVADLNDSVILSASGAHWEDTVPDWNNLASDIRGTAMIVNALTQIDPENPLLPNAVRWLMIARTADHWPTGQDNAWSLSALSEWMAASGEMDIDYDYKIAMNGRGLSQGHVGADDAAASERLAVSISELLPEEANFIDFRRGTGDGRLYYTVHLDSFIDANDLEEVNRGIIVQRAYYDASCDPAENECESISEIESGQQVRVELTMIVPNDLLYAVLQDPIPAGTEAIDPGLQTTGSSPGGTWSRNDPDYQYGYWGWWYFDRIEYRDNEVNFLSNYLPAGTYQFTYHLQTTIPGEYQVIPATARQEFFPEVFGRSQGQVFTITD